MKMVKLFLLLIIFWLGKTEISASASASDAEEVIEVKIRDGLPNFFEKASRGDTLKIAYLGGSITAQEGWRVYSFEWLKETFPKANFVKINAAIGGTGSDFGAFRLREHVLSKNPDLVFVEFAVNDADKTEERILRSMEGIVRTIWKKETETDICFIYTLKGDFLDLEMRGELPSSVKTMERVADWYGIPSINFGHKVCRLITKNQLIFKGKEMQMNGISVFSPDGVHPYLETGHQIYFHTLKHSFKKIQKKESTAACLRNNKEPLEPTFYADPRMVDFRKVNRSENWQIINPENHPHFVKFHTYLPAIGKAIPGETLSFRFKGKAIGIYDIMGPSAGRVLLEIDGIPKDTIYRFDKYSTYYRMNYLLFDDLKDQEHEVVFRVMTGTINKIDILGKLGNVMQNPDDYTEHNWYVGKLLLDGFMLP